MVAITQRPGPAGATMGPSDAWVVVGTRREPKRRSDREREPRLGCEPKTGEQEDQKYNAEELKAVNRDKLAQQCVALKDADDPEIDEPAGCIEGHAQPIRRKAWLLKARMVPRIAV